MMVTASFLAFDDGTTLFYPPEVELGASPG